MKFYSSNTLDIKNLKLK